MELKNLIYIDEMQRMIEKEVLYAVELLKEKEKERKKAEKEWQNAKDRQKRAYWENELRKLDEWRLAKDVTPMMFWGPPGSGKTQGIAAAVDQIIEEHGLRVGKIFTYLSSYDPVAVRGMPVVDRDRKLTEWYPQSTFPNDEFASQFDVVVWVLDELSAAPKAIQPPIYRLLQEGQIEGYKVPRNVIMVAAGNDKDDRAVAVDMSSAMANRMVHFDVQPTLDPWKVWAIRNRIHPLIIAFHNMNKGQYLHGLNTETLGMIKAFPTLRSWEKVSHDLYRYEKEPERLRELRVIGHVGMEAGTAFNTFYRVHNQLPDPERILDKGDFSQIPKEDDILFATLSNLVANMVGNVTPERMENFLSYVEKSTQNRKEIGYMAVSDLARSDRNALLVATRTKAWVKWADVITKMLNW